MQQEGIFSDYAQEFYEYGLQPIPVVPFKKACLDKGYDKVFYDQKIDQDTLDKYIKSHGKMDIAIVCGSMSGVIGIDYDFEGQKDADTLERMLIEGLPRTPAIKKGKKGWTRFYKYNEAVSQTRSFKRYLPEKNKDETFVDLLSNRRITVMPPSRHSKGIDYEWIGTKHLIDCIEDLPEITAEDVKHIEFVCKLDLESRQEEDKKKESRHEKIFGFVIRESNRAENIDDLAEKTLTHDRTVNADDPKGPYFDDKKNTKREKPLDAARLFCERVANWKAKSLLADGVLWEIGKTSTNYWKNIGTNQQAKWVRSEAASDFNDFFHTILPSARKDFLTGAVFHKEAPHKDWFPVENDIKWLRAKAAGVGLNRSVLDDALAAWMKTLVERPLFEVKPWDGKDYIGQMCEHITWADADTELVTELFKDWMAGVFRRMYNSEMANRMIIMRGPQGIGKDNWINHLCGGFGRNHGEISIEPRKKVENFIALDGLVVGFIAEFDETMDVPISMLKALITSKSATYRRPYDKMAINADLKYSLISSVNFEDILRDTTGNRRFIVLDAESIKWDYKKAISKESIIAQAHALYLKEYRAGEKAEAYVKAKLEEEAPINSEDLFIQEFAGLIESITNNINGLRNEYLTKDLLKFSANERSIIEDKFKIRWKMIAEETVKIGKRYSFGVKRCQKVIKRYGFSNFDRVNTHYFLPTTYKSAEETVKNESGSTTFLNQPQNNHRKH